MADKEKGLPVRTEDDSNQYVRIKIYDSTGVNPANVDSSNRLYVFARGNNPSATDVGLRLSELGAPNPDGDYDVSNNTKPASCGLIAHERNATLDDTKLNNRVTAVAGESNSMCLDIALHDASGNEYDADNPLPTYQVDEVPGTEVHDYDEGVDVAADGTDDHDYSVADGDDFQLRQVIASASSRFKIELKIGDGAASEVFATKAVWFVSEKQGDFQLTLAIPIKVTGTVNTTTVRLTRTNRDDDDAQSIYSTIIGRTE
jgi:hypothetical protein